MLVFDIETTGVPFEDPLWYDKHPTKVHCIVTYDTESKVIGRYNDQGPVDTIQDGIDLLKSQKTIGGHNVSRFDIPVLEKLYDFKPRDVVLDSKALSEMHWGADLRWMDSRRHDNGQSAPPKGMFGRHSLEAWGHRLGEHKGDYKATTEATGKDPWAKWSMEMEDYCVQDVMVNVQLFERLARYVDLQGPAAIMESALARVLFDVERTGFGFDISAATKLYAELSQKRNALRVNLTKRFPSFWLSSGHLKTPGKSLNYKDPQRGDYTRGAQYQPVKLKEFNPSSGDHIALMLRRHYGWKPRPDQHTANGKPQVTEEILKTLRHPECQQLAEHMVLEKRIGQLAEGNKAWLKVEHQGRLYGRYEQNGTRTGRMAHRNPNLAQVPRTGNPYGEECRRLFIPTKGRVLVGGDASGIELRMLGHYMARWDDGEFGRLLLEGDVHTENQLAVGLRTRDAAKTFIYAMLYGAGDEKLGRIVSQDLGSNFTNPESLRKLGRRGRAAINRRFPAFDILSRAATKSGKSGKIRAIDGRSLWRGVTGHNGLNTLLQSGAGIVMKQAAVIFAPTIQGPTRLVAHIHDELQVETLQEHADEVGKKIVLSIRLAGYYYGLRVPLDGEYKVGASWAETH